MLLLIACLTSSTWGASLLQQLCLYCTNTYFWGSRWSRKGKWLVSRSHRPLWFLLLLLSHLGLATGSWQLEFWKPSEPIRASVPPQLYLWFSSSNGYYNSLPPNQKLPHRWVPLKPGHYFAGCIVLLNSEGWCNVQTYTKPFACSLVAWGQGPASRDIHYWFQCSSPAFSPSG